MPDGRRWPTHHRALPSLSPYPRGQSMAVPAARAPPRHRWHGHAGTALDQAPPGCRRRQMPGSLRPLHGLDQSRGIPVPGKRIDSRSGAPLGLELFRLCRSGGLLRNPLRLGPESLGPVAVVFSLALLRPCCGGGFPLRGTCRSRGVRERPSICETQITSHVHLFATASSENWQHRTDRSTLLPHQPLLQHLR